jgi:hypothetical protein
MRSSQEILVVEEAWATSLGHWQKVITWVGVEERQFVVVSADRMEIQVRDMAEAL